MKQRKKLEKLSALCLAVVLLLSLAAQGLTTLAWAETESETSVKAEVTEETLVTSSDGEGEESEEGESEEGESEEGESEGNKSEGDKSEEEETEKDETQEGEETEGDDSQREEPESGETNGEETEGEETEDDPQGGVPAAIDEDGSTKTSTYIYFDLAAGNVTINNNTYTGYIYKTKDGETKIDTVTGKHSNDNQYYIYQSTEDNQSTTGMVGDEMKLPEYEELKYKDKAWSDYITNNSDVSAVITGWYEAIEGTGRTATQNKIELSGASDITVVLDNIYSTYAPDDKNDGPIKVTSLSDNAVVTLKLKGDSRVRNIYYKHNSNNGCKLVIDNYAETDKFSGSITVAALTTEISRNGNEKYNKKDKWPDCLAVIGAADNAEYGLTFSGGTVFAGFPEQSDIGRVWNDRTYVAFATCVGGGNNQPGEVTITGGRLTAVSNGTSPAIGGGGGYKLTGDPGYVSISGGEVYAYSFGIYSIYNGYYGFVPTTTIGGASTFNGEARKGTTVEISGGYVFAQSVGGTAIGGGGSRNGTGGDATVTISGGTVVAKSIASEVCTSQKDKTQTISVSAGNAIGGGVGTTGGDATVSISGGKVTATAIGGGTAKASATGSTSGNGGAATVTISGGETTLTTGIGGGDSEFKNGGDATVVITGGSITAGKYIGGGTGGIGITDSNGKKTSCVTVANGGSATIYVTDGYIHTGTIGGGDTESKNAASTIGFARAYISGGDIQGQFLLKGKLESGVTDKKTIEAGRCEFIMTGGKIYNVSATNTDYPNREPDGGAVWMDDLYGVVTISGGSIENCSAQKGGAVYMTNGTFTLTGTGQITGCSVSAVADDLLSGRGGAVYLGGGRAVVGVDRQLGSDGSDTEEGTVTVLSYLGLEATEDATAPLITTAVTPNTAKLTCSISNCSATYGGALYVSGNDEDENSVTNEVNDGASLENKTIDPQNYNVYVSGGSISGNSATKSGGGVCVNNGHILMDGGTVTENTAAGNGGGIYLSSAAREEARVRIRSGSLTKNIAGENGGAIAVEGSKDTGLVMKITIGVNISHYKDGTFENPDHINDGNTTEECPVLTENQAEKYGGAIYISGTENSILNIYCLDESDNKANGDFDGDYRQSDFLEVDGGTVKISTGTKETNGEGESGYVKIKDSIHVIGGVMDIYGHMANPNIDAMITVDLNDNTDRYSDHRVYVDETDEMIYLINYFENFLGADGVRTGRFRSFPVKQDVDDNYLHTIISTLFTRKGYEIRGWNTESEGTGNWYSVGDVYSFVELTGETNDVKNIQTHQEDGELVSDLVTNDSTTLGAELTTLNLYAIWKQIAYTIHFEANAENYSGSMADQSCPVEDASAENKITLSKNEYSVAGCEFAGWNTKADGTGDNYEDGATIENALGADGTVVTLYAQWKPCEHSGEDKFTYTSDGNTITATCTCGYWEKLTITGEDTVYDGAEHPATFSYSTSDGSTELKSKLSNENNLTVSYVRTKTLWTTGEKEDSTSFDVPINAGVYTATVTLQDDENISATTSYTIQKANQDAPGKPTYEITGNSVKVIPASSDPEGKTYENALRYYEDGVLTSWDEAQWGTNNTIDLTTGQTTYLVYTRYAEDENYYASEPTKADSNFYFAGDITVILKTEEGINAVAIGDKTTEVNGETIIEGVTITAWLEDGYYLVGDAFDVTKNTVSDDPNTHVDQPNWTKDTPTADVYTETYSTNNIHSNTVTTFTFSGVRKAPTVAAKSVERQVFHDFTGKETTISRDSAYTAQFAVSSYTGADYASQRLTFDAELPEGTTIILKSGGNYWHYEVENSSNSIAMTDFIQMGGTDTFSYDTSSEESTSFTYQFVVDFSQVDEDNRLSAGALAMSLILVPNSETNAPTVSESLTIGLAGVAAYTLTPSADNTTTATLTCEYTASSGAASIWDGRTTALVLTAPDTIPADLYLRVTVEGKTMNCYRNGKNQFIIPLSEVGSSVVTVTLCSSLFPVGETAYAFTAEWYVSNSKAGSSPLNGDMADTCSVTFQAEEEISPSVKIEGEAHVLTTSGTLETKISYQDVPADAEVLVAIYRKNDKGTYDTTGKIIEPKRKDDPAVEVVETATFPQSMNGLSEGSYKLVVTVERGELKLAETSYYFILLSP